MNKDTANCHGAKLLHSSLRGALWNFGFETSWDDHDLEWISSTSIDIICQIHGWSSSWSHIYSSDSPFGCWCFLVERKICSSKCGGSGWSYQQRKKKVHGFLPSGNKYVREPPNFLVLKSFLFENESRAAALQASKVITVEHSWSIDRWSQFLLWPRRQGSVLQPDS